MMLSRACELLGEGEDDIRLLSLMRDEVSSPENFRAAHLVEMLLLDWRSVNQPALGPVFVQTAW